MMERCDGGYYMYLPSWRVIDTSRTMTIAVWGERGGRGGIAFPSLSSLLSSRVSSLSPSHYLLIFLPGNIINKKTPRKEKKEIKWRDPRSKVRYNLFMFCIKFPTRLPT